MVAVHSTKIYQRGMFRGWKRKKSMFALASDYNQDLSNWNVSRVRNFRTCFTVSPLRPRLPVYPCWRCQELLLQLILALQGATVVMHCNYELLLSFFAANANHGHPCHCTTTGANFSQNLCAWGPLLRKKNAIVISMFENTACPDQSDPKLTAMPAGPFCFPCTLQMPIM